MPYLIMYETFILNLQAATHLSQRYMYGSDVEVVMPTSYLALGYNDV